jgi:hypothetical protein
LTFLTEIPTNKKRVTYKSNENDWLSDDDKFVILAKKKEVLHVRCHVINYSKSHHIITDPHNLMPFSYFFLLFLFSGPNLRGCDGTGLHRVGIRVCAEEAGGVPLRVTSFARTRVHPRGTSIPCCPCQPRFS